MLLPYEIRNQIIQCIGLCFHYKDNVEAFFLSCGVSRHLASKHREQAKFVWTRNLLSDLDELPDGDIIQRKILTELCKMRKLPDKDAVNPDAGLAALRKLKELAMANKIEFEEYKKDIQIKKNIAEERVKIFQERSRMLTELKNCFYENITSNNRQEAGYILEDILVKLFSLFDIEYRKSYKLGTQQIDGHFRYEGFDYLVEVKWKKDLPNEQEIGGFERKITTKLESTRGIIISINGFREDVIKQFEGRGAKILFFSGEDLIHILEGRIDLREALQFKIKKAAQEGKVYTEIAKML